MLRAPGTLGRVVNTPKLGADGMPLVPTSIKKNRKSKCQCKKCKRYVQDRRGAPHPLANKGNDCFLNSIAHVLDAVTIYTETNAHAHQTARGSPWPILYHVRSRDLHSGRF